jgi:uncharacterized protein DUF1843
LRAVVENLFDSPAKIGYKLSAMAGRPGNPGRKAADATQGGVMAEQERSSAVPYGPPIQEAIAKGDLARMKQLVGEAESHLQQVGGRAGRARISENRNRKTLAQKVEK